MRTTYGLCRLSSVHKSCKHHNEKVTPCVQRCKCDTNTSSMFLSDYIL